MKRPDVLPQRPEERHRERRAWRLGRAPASREPASREPAASVAETAEVRAPGYLQRPPAASETPASEPGRSTRLTRLGAQLRLDSLCYAVDNLEALDREWAYFMPERRFSVSLTWQYLITGTLPALHRHYLLELMAREQCLRYETLLKDLGRSRAVIRRLDLFPPWRTLETITSEAVLEREIPGRRSRRGRGLRPRGRLPDGRRGWRKRVTDRLRGAFGAGSGRTSR